MCKGVMPSPLRTYPDYRSLRDENAFLRGRVKELDLQHKDAEVELQEGREARVALAGKAAADAQTAHISMCELQEERAQHRECAQRLRDERLETARLQSEIAELRIISCRLAHERLSQAASAQQEAVVLRVSLAEAEEESCRWRTEAEALGASLAAARAELEELRTTAAELTAASEGLRGELAVATDSLQAVRRDEASLHVTLGEQARLLASAAETREAMGAQLQREVAEVDASKERAAAAEATSLAERSARAMAEAEARAATLLQQEQLVAIRSRCSWLEGKLAEADAATRRAIARERRCEVESSEMALRMGLFQRLVTTDAKRAPLPVGVRKAPFRAESARKGAWERQQRLEQAAR